MKAIYASKLYKASNRKDRIQAAMAAPGNLSLVQQLAESLDEEYQTPSNLGEPEKAEHAPEEAQPDFIVDEEIDPETDLMKMEDIDLPSGSGGGPKTVPHHSSSPAGSEDLPPDSPGQEEGESKPAPAEEPKEPAEASTKINANTELDLAVIKGSLNGREDTAGVLRITEKEDEIWIYYKDEVNLNNLMTEVIEYLETAGYTNLEFNRLARSDNAIVFEVITSSESTDQHTAKQNF